MNELISSKEKPPAPHGIKRSYIIDNDNVYTNLIKKIDDEKTYLNVREFEALFLKHSA